MPSSVLPPPEQFRPWMGGRYTVAPGLAKLAGPAFLLDARHPLEVAEKHRILADRAEHHIALADFPLELERAVAGLIGRRLAREYPALFRLEGDRLQPVHNVGVESAGARSPAIDLAAAGAFDALARAVQEDLAVLRVHPDGADTNAALHISFPNGWDPREKIGRSFFQTHVPIPQIEPINRKAGEFARMMVRADQGLVRFVWGLRFDDFLDHHPQAPEGTFDPNAGNVWVRVERQTILGLPAHSAALFLIKTYLSPVAMLRSEERVALAEAVESMSPASAEYKGVARVRQPLVQWLRQAGT